MVDYFGPDLSMPYRIPQAQTAMVEVPDCFGGYPGRGEPGGHLRPNPVTGPIAISGIRPGDTLAVTIHRIEPVGQGFIGSRDRRTWLSIDTAAATVSHPAGLSFPLRPCIGTIGLCPDDAPVETTLAGDHGGNMDCNIVGEGTTICFAVRVPEAGLAMGDVHAAMGDGEVSGQGVECAARITFSASRVPGLGLGRPYGIRDGAFFTIAWGTSVEEAVDRAQGDMTRALADLCELDQATAYRLLGLFAHLRFGWATGLRPTVWLEIDTAVLPPEARAKLADALSPAALP